MSLMSWLFPGKKRSKADPHSTMTSAADSRRSSARDTAPGSSAKRKSDRAERRELLYSVVREAMVRAGVLSASYKFKVLSLDAEGRQFLIMVDLARAAGGDAANLAKIEALIAQSAKARHELLVTAVYWRVNEHAAVDHANLRRPARAAPGSQANADSQPYADSLPAALHSVPAPVVAPPAKGSANDPIQAGEVEAFKRALVTGSRPAPLAADPDAEAQGPAGKGAHRPHSYTLITGFEDTEQPDDHKAPLLGGTQYGELR